MVVMDLAAEELLGLYASACLGKTPERAFPPGSLSDSIGVATEATAGMEREISGKKAGGRVLLLRSAPVMEPPDEKHVQSNRKSGGAGSSPTRIGTIIARSRAQASGCT